jgi:hypothetical protein
MNEHDDMSDTAVLDAARDSLCRMPVARPPDVEAIMARGRAHRRHRRMIPAVTSAAVVAGTAAAVALAVTTLAPVSYPASAPASHPDGREPAVQLAAWTVTKLADGDISVTIRELKDPAGLQSTLRADGVPASVTFASAQNPACRPYPGGTPQQLPRPSTPLLKQVFPKPYDMIRIPKRPAVLSKIPPGSNPVTPPAPSLSDTPIVIKPSALPASTGVQLGISYEGGAILLPHVVYASAACTGS